MEGATIQLHPVLAATRSRRRTRKTETASAVLPLGRHLAGGKVGVPVTMPIRLLEKHTVVLAGAGWEDRTSAAPSRGGRATRDSLHRHRLCGEDGLATLGEAWPSRPSEWDPRMRTGPTLPGSLRGRPLDARQGGRKSPRVRTAPGSRHLEPRRGRARVGDRHGLRSTRLDRRGGQLARCAEQAGAHGRSGPSPKTEEVPLSSSSVSWTTSLRTQDSVSPTRRSWPSRWPTPLRSIPCKDSVNPSGSLAFLPVRDYNGRHAC